jgi:hypothetical protein
MPLAKKIGIGFAVVHLVAFIIFALYLQLSTEGQAWLLWTLWLPLDFPVSLIILKGFDLIPPDSLPGRAVRTWLPYLVHGVLGTIWWFFIPVVIGGIFNRLRREDRVRKAD